jgi:hypothetical protein
MTTRKSLDDLCEVWHVHEPGMWENDVGPKDWWAVSNEDGIKAYFGDEADAFRWRMDQISRELNP